MLCRSCQAEFTSELSCHQCTKLPSSRTTTSKFLWSPAPKSRWMMHPGPDALPVMTCPRCQAEFTSELSCHQCTRLPPSRTTTSKFLRSQEQTSHLKLPSDLVSLLLIN